MTSSTAFRHLRITPGEWDAFMDDVAQTLDKFAVPAAERAEVVAIVESSPENPNVTQVVLAGVNPNQDLRYLNDVTIIFKATDKLTFITDLNYIRDDGFGATGGGVAQYAAYAINDWLKIVGRSLLAVADEVIE